MAIFNEIKGKKETVCLSTPDTSPIDIFHVETANETMEAASGMDIPNMLFGELIFEKELTVLFSSAGIGKTMLARYYTTELYKILYSQHCNQLYLL